MPHSHTDQLVGKLATLVGDDTVPNSDHMNIPYLEATQALIASFLTKQFRKPATTPQLPPAEPPALQAEVGPELGPAPAPEAAVKTATAPLGANTMTAIAK